MDFDQFREYISNIPAPASRLGIFNLNIKNAGRRYHFRQLKETASNNPDLCGFSLNHCSSWQKQICNKSKFHDEDNVNISIWRSEFVSASRTPSCQRVILKMKTWTAIIDWTQKPF